MGFANGAERAQSGRGPSATTRPNCPTGTCPVESEYYLHVDADRDGVVDADRTYNERWTWGVGSKGAIILCNNDDEDRRRACDNEDARINGAPDPDDIAPLVIRRAPGHPPAPAAWRGFLEVSPEDAPRIRIFASRSAGAAQVLGAGVGAGPAVHSWRLPNLNFTEKELGIEAVMYPQGRFTGEIEVVLRIERGALVARSERVKMRVAPWIAFHHLDPTTRVYVGEAEDNARFRGALAAEVAAAGLPAAEVVPPPHGRDRWLQDAMEIGFSTLPRRGPPASRHLPVVLRTANNRNTPTAQWGIIDRYPREKMLEPGFGWVQAMPPTNDVTTLDSFGNLECSPPFTHSGRSKEYKFGRLVYGEHPGGGLRRNMQREVVDFLRAQRVQEPFALDTGWLYVGHVDEVMSFVPMADAPKKFRVALASPRVAMQIVRRLAGAGNGAAPLFQGIDGAAGAPRQMAPYRLGTVDAVLGDAAFLAVQTRAQGKIDAIKATMTRELDLAESDFIELPVLFMDLDAGYLIAYTPGVVNMLVLTKPDRSVRLCMPKPFGPVVDGVCQFEAHIRTAMGAAPIAFIDDFLPYHVLQGEVHCGTNSKREPAVDRWWWEQQV